MFKHYFCQLNFRTAIILFLMQSGSAIMAQQTIPLYTGNIPGAKKTADKETSTYNADSILIVTKISRPTITIYLPEKNKATGAAIIVFPGGGYNANALGHEGHDVGEWLKQHGITAFVVKYRIPDTTTMTNKEIGPLQDAEQAIMTVRSRAAEWGIKPDRIGVLGFSAGGHLASTLSTHYRENLVKSNISLRPDFSVLIYPVISFEDSIGHSGSRESLLGKNASPEKIAAYSNQLAVDKETPPAFIAHAKDDGVSYKNSVVYADALRKNNVTVELLLFSGGGHGFGMVNKEAPMQWPDELVLWLKKMKFI